MSKIHIVYHDTQLDEENGKNDLNGENPNKRVILDDNALELLILNKDNGKVVTKIPLTKVSATNVIGLQSAISTNTDVSANTLNRHFHNNKPILDAIEDNGSNEIITNEERTKLQNIESGAQVNQSNSEIKLQYEANDNTNAYTDAEKTKLSQLDPGKQHNQNSDTKLDEGTANEVSSLEIRGHIDDLDKHREIDDSTQASDSLWSSSKIASEISAAASGTGSTLLSPVQNVTTLKAIDTTNPTNYPDKALINVEDNGLYRLDRDSSEAEDIDRIIAPTTGVGRWYKMSSPINDHNNLSSIQGGAVGERYHLTQAEYSALHSHDNKAVLDAISNAGSGIIISDAERTKLAAQRVTFLKNSAPTVNDDQTLNYRVGDLWIDQSSDPKNTYQLMDATAGAAVWQRLTSEDASGNIVIQGAILYGQSATVQINSNTDNLIIPDLDKTTYVRILTTGNYSVTGIVKSDTSKIQAVDIINKGLNNVTLKNLNNGSNSDYRFDLGADVLIQPGEGARLIYDNVDFKWSSNGKNI